MGFGELILQVFKQNRDACLRDPAQRLACLNRCQVAAQHVNSDLEFALLNPAPLDIQHVLEVETFRHGIFDSGLQIVDHFFNAEFQLVKKADETSPRRLFHLPLKAKIFRKLQILEFALQCAFEEVRTAPEPIRQLRGCAHDVGDQGQQVRPRVEYREQID